MARFDPGKDFKQIAAWLGLSGVDVYVSAQRLLGTCLALQRAHRRNPKNHPELTKSLWPILNQRAEAWVLLDQELLSDGNHLPVPAQFARFLKELCWSRKHKNYGGSLGAAIGCHLHGYPSQFVREELLPRIEYMNHRDRTEIPKSNPVASQFSRTRNEILDNLRDRFKLKLKLDESNRIGSDIFLDGEKRSDLYDQMLPCLRLLTPRTSHVWKLDRYPASVTLTPYSGWEGKWLPQHQLICPDCFTSLMTSWTPPREKPREDFTMPNFSQNNKTEGHRVSADSFAAYAKEVEVRARSLDAVYQEATERFNIGVETLRRTKLPPNIRVCADEVSFPESTKLSLSMPLTDYPQRLRLLDGNRVLADLPFPVIPAEEETFEFDYQFSGFTLTIEGTISDGHLKFRQKLRPDSSWLGKVYDWSGWKLPFTAWPVTAALVLTLFTAGILLVPQFASIRRVGMEPNLNQTLGAGAKEIISGSILSLRTFVIDMKLPSNSIGLQNSWEIYDQGGLVRQGECGGVPATCSIPFSPLDRWRHRDVQISVTIPNGRRSDNLVRFD